MSNIKIPAKHYVGLSNRITGRLPTGYMTPWGTDSAAKKRMKTIDYQIGSVKFKLQPLVIDNEPMHGFRVTSPLRESDYGETNWRVEDPRGFEVEISSGNLALLINAGLIDHGEITSECIWARQGSENILVSTETNDYITAVENTKVASKYTPWKDVTIGNKIVLIDNTKGIYLGKMYVLFKPYRRDVHDNNQLTHNLLESTAKPVYAIYNETKKEFLMLFNPKLSFIEDSTQVLSVSQANILANSLINDDKVYCRYHGGKISGPVFMCSSSPINESNLSTTLVEANCTLSEISTILADYRSNCTIFAKLTNGKTGALSSTNDVTTFLWKELSIDHLNRGQIRFFLDEIGHFRNSRYSPKIVTVDFAAIDSFYHIQVDIKAKDCNELTKLICPL